MKISLKRVDKSLPLPTYQTDGSVCFDLLIREAVTIMPHTLALLPTNIILKVPEGFMLLIAPRSSTPKKKGLLVPHGMGIIDQDYNGPEDEVLFQVLNYTDNTVMVEKGERLAQGCIVPVQKVVFEEVEDSKEKNRGGLGSTG